MLEETILSKDKGHSEKLKNRLSMTNVRRGPSFVFVSVGGTVRL